MQDLTFDTTISIDPEELKEFITEVLLNLLLENTTNFGIAAFVLQAAHDAYNNIAEKGE